MMMKLLFDIDDKLLVYRLRKFYAIFKLHLCKLHSAYFAHHVSNTFPACLSAGQRVL
jgi:hypothetical protein